MRKPMKKIRTLVFSGGGTKCISFIGAVRALQELNMYNYHRVKTFAGTSGGALIAALLIAGYSPEDLMQRICEIDFSKLQHFSLKKVFTLYGLDSGYNFISEMEKLFEERGFSKRITMKNFYELTRKELYIATTCVNKFKPIYIHHSNFPDISVVHALRMSISVPFIFTSVKYRNDVYVDGGVLDNFPITIFDKNDKHLFGLYLNQFKDQTEINVNITNIQEYTIALMSAMSTELQSLKIREYVDRTTEICIRENSLDFTITAEKIEKYLSIGYDSIMYQFNEMNSTDANVEATTGMCPGQTATLNLAATEAADETRC